MCGLQVFLLDDYLEMQSTVREVVERNHGVLHPSRSLEEAVAWLEANPTIRLDVAFIDLMIPLESAALPLIDDLLDRRAEACLIATRRARTEKEKQQKADADLKLDAIDGKLGELIPVDGGIQFLRNAAEKQLIGKLGRKLAVFSARRPDHMEPGGAQTLRAEAEAAAGRSFDEWFEKPTPIQDLEEWLSGIMTDPMTGTATTETKT